MQHHIEFLTEGIAIIRLRGELDHHAASTIRKDLTTSIYSGNLHALIWNLQDLHFMDSAGVGLILGRMRDMIPSNGQTVILNPSQTMKKIFQFSGLGQNIWNTSEEEAIQTLGGILNGK